MEIKTVKIDTLKPHPMNPRVHPESAIVKLERSITEFGWTTPILATKDGVILAGHARYNMGNSLMVGCAKAGAGRGSGHIP